MKTDIRNIAPAARELSAYLRSASMVCSPGRAALSQGDITVVEAPLEAISLSKEGKLPAFVKLDQLRNTLRSSIEEIVANNKSGTVLYTAHTPTDHVRCFLLHWALWAELAFVCAERTSLSKQLPFSDPITKFQDCALQAIKSNGSQDTISITIGERTRSLFTTAMSPHYKAASDRPDPRYAPYFCVAIVTREAVAALRDTQGALSTGILTEAFSRVNTPYNALVSYVLPGLAAHLHPFAKKAMRAAVAIIKIEPDLLAKPEAYNLFVSEFAKCMMFTGATTPSGVDTTGIVVRMLVKKNILPGRIVDTFEAAFAELTESARPRCPFSGGGHSENSTH